MFYLPQFFFRYRKFKIDKITLQHELNMHGNFKNKIEEFKKEEIKFLQIKF